MSGSVPLIKVLHAALGSRDNENIGGTSVASQRSACYRRYPLTSRSAHGHSFVPAVVVKLIACRFRCPRPFSGVSPTVCIIGTTSHRRHR